MAICVAMLPISGHQYLIADDSGTQPELCASVVISGSEYKHYQDLYLAANAPFDYVQASLIFGFFFSFIFGLFYVSRNIGLILESVRRF